MNQPNQTRYTTSSLKFIIGWMVVFAIRLIPAPIRPPNVEPVLATLMPFSKRYGAGGGFSFGFLSIALFDLFTRQLGLWTLITGIAYGALGVGSHFFFRHRASRVKNYLIVAVIGTLAYDASTGLTIGPIFFGQTFTEALWGQIPFTINHVLGNIALSAIASPLLYRWVVANRVLETDALWKKLRATTI